MCDRCIQKAGAGVADVTSSWSLEAKHFIAGPVGSSSIQATAAIREFCSAVFLPFSTFCLLLLLHPSSFCSSNITCISGIIIGFMLCGFVCFALKPFFSWLCPFTYSFTFQLCSFTALYQFQFFYSFQCSASERSSISLFIIAIGG